MTTQVIKMESTIKYSGIFVTALEMEILKHIYETRVMPTECIHRLYIAGAENGRSGAGITMRLRKLVNSGILYQMNDNNPKRTTWRPIQYAYRLAARGYNVLEQAGYITIEEAERGKEYSRHLNMPTDHNKILSTALVSLNDKITENGDTFASLKVKSLRGDRHELFSQENFKNMTNSLIPDWVYETKNRLICIEVDTGTQSHSVIQSKYERYKKVSALFSKPISVIFSVGEPDVSPKERRVGYLKEILQEQTEWPAQLNLYVLSTHRTESLVYKLIMSSPETMDLRKKIKVNRWILNSLSAAPKGITFKTSNDDQIKKLFYEDSYDLDAVAEIRINNTVNFVGVLHMEEGAVKDFQRARANMKRVEKWNDEKSTLAPTIPLLLIYDEQEALQNDSIALIPKCRTLLLSNEAVKAAADTKLRNYPSVLEIASQFTRKEVRLL